MAQTDGRRRRTVLRRTYSAGRVTEILYGLHGERRERVAALRKRGDFFWLDASLSETGLDDLVDALDLRAPDGRGDR
jgi:hypothetical protein